MIKSRISSFLSRANEVSQRYPIVFPLTLLIFALVTYGVYIFSLGFYWDDWPPILLSHITDKSIIWDYFTYDRPFQSWTYYLLFPICRDSTILWQLFAILFRWTSALVLYFTFLQVFPRQRSLLQWAAVIFIVFPGFSDQYVSVPYASVFLTYTVYGLSLFFMVMGIKKPKKLWIYFPLSLVFTITHLFTMEYFAGIELLRPLMIFFLLNDTSKKKAKAFFRTMLYWLPYIVVLGFFIYWRMKIYPGITGNDSSSNYPYLISNFLKSPMDTLFTFMQTIYSDLRFLLIDSWTDRLLPGILEVKNLTFWLSVVIGLGVTSILNLFFQKDQQTAEFHLIPSEIGKNILVSLTIILFGLFPVWSTLRQITKGKWSERFDLPVIFGVAILLLTMLYLIVQRFRPRNVILIFIVGLSISYQLQIGNEYRKDFIRQKDFYTQLAWRIPSLEPGTTIFSPGIPSSKEADYSISMGINMLFDSNEIEPSMDYWFSGPRYYNPTDLLKNPGTLIRDGLRNFQFSGSASKIVSVHMTDSGCLWVIDPYYAMIPESIDLLTTYGDLTNQDLIGEIAPDKNHLSEIIDTGPQKTWCYYFEKGDLAQSKGKMEEAIGYYEQAMSEILIPMEAIEYLPFVKAYAKLGQIDKAVELTALSFKRTGYAKPSLCQVWHDVLNDNPEISLSSIDSVYNSINCSWLIP